MFDTLKKHSALIFSVVAALAIGAALFYFQEDIQSWLSLLKSDRTHPFIVITAFLVLPAIFFPISALLVLVGVRFGALWGSLIMFSLIPAHLLFSFFLVRRLFRSQLEWLARKKDYGILNVPEDRYVQFGFLFMAVPGLPYTVKNYLLPVSGISFRDYFWIGWLVQGVMGIPFVVLGDAAAQWSIQILAVFMVLFIVAYFISKKLQKKYERVVRPEPDR